MGQQQLLLLVLGIVIVGIAVVAGIQAFGEGRKKAQQDAAVSDAMRIISDVQAWKLKPGAFGGGADLATEASFVGASLQALGYPTSGSNIAYQTINGCYTMTAAATGATINVYKLAAGAQPSTTPAVTSCTGEQIANILVNGASPSNIAWNYGAAASSGSGSSSSQ